jgi:hypothetical protein
MSTLFHLLGKLINFIKLSSFLQGFSIKQQKFIMRTQTILIIASIVASASAQGALRGNENELLKAKYQKLAAEVSKLRNMPPSWPMTSECL